MGLWWIGLAGSLCLAGAAYWRRSLSGSGALAAVVLGTALYALGSASWFGTLIAFFLSSSLLSKWKQRRKAAAESGYEKSGRRDAVQVWANGGLGLALCAACAVRPEPALYAAFVGVMAAVNADTWATEIGGLSRSEPRSILTGRRVAAGTSGGVTPLGLAATAAGGLFIGAAAWLLQRLDAVAPGGLDSAAAAGAYGGAELLALGLVGGAVGSLADSALGAAWQRMYRCRVCGRELEARRHCGEAAEHIRGWRALGNDAVNVLGSMAGGAAALLVGVLLL
ncbi:DUF92 domain-containing protein [Paenibacillus koleovorans]|uniref:DUF92 domain-containing protein n=1 Tax=Paenibacillus koleovorans TaxID=121608 RepID=UPI000FDC6DE1|nr:DUF92 domain-containing protein [Paenibacillus koleovorans]